MVRPLLTPRLAAVAPPDAFLLSWAEGVLRDALHRSPRLDSRRYEIFGQGSRVNGTYLEPTSDIDLVLMLRAPFGAGYGWEDFRDDVLAVLGESYTVRMGRRCLNVDDPDSLFGEMVDVLVATEHRFQLAPGRYEQGVFFRDREGRPIVNFPKQHRRNGDAKDGRTGGRFKAAVRTAKRVRKLAERERMIAEGAAPSYLLECLLFNVPDRVYRGGRPYRAALDWLHRHADSLAGLPCQNGINRLFGPGPDQWEPGQAVRIIDVLHEI
ncbi:nucleotidyltransferase domain-containing protein [Actinoplanes siamensis]|uniref:Nucleotidyltransferase n=1 Tax=Actinoplanes siamensis TaxID=1223317 RepID=A0A919K9A8_9ACTN|nr:nucleotidyltransferase [Actinoplanes siamensis]GIF03397.1 nucleotidyltransferase [Actinoplanes siamensis]